LVDLRRDQIDFDTANLAVRRAKKGSPSPHPIRGDELRALRKLARKQEPKSAFAFTSERGAPFTKAGFARMVERAGQSAKLGFKAYPHMLRCGFALANKGHDTRALQAYPGHRNIQHTVRYTELAPGRSKDFLGVVDRSFRTFCDRERREEMWRSGLLRHRPGVPRTGWRRQREIDFETPEANCDWCGRAIRHVSLMTHPDWQDSVRVGRVCAICMSRRRENFLSPSAAKDLLQREFRQYGWAYFFWVLVVLMVVALVDY
jgi:type 1 fimbriae regulatory protein FimB/type 1 fimbriae regulatory protein FimE